MTGLLAKIEHAENVAVSAMAESACDRHRFNELAEGLTKLRALKKIYLQQHPDETTKVDPSDPRLTWQALQRLQDATAKALFAPSRLKVIGCGDDFLRALYRRAA